jgi:hypothetical protein
MSEATPPPPTTPKTVSDKKRFFENVMEDQQKPTPKSGKIFVITKNFRLTIFQTYFYHAKNKKEFAKKDKSSIYALRVSEFCFSLELSYFVSFVVFHILEYIFFYLFRVCFFKKLCYINEA